MTIPTYEAAVIGAGPYGMAATAHLLDAGIETRVFGDVMGFWKRQMPAGMFLRSIPDASDIADPHGSLSLRRYVSEKGLALERPIPRQLFIGYGEWFQSQTTPDVDPRKVTTVEKRDGHFRVTLDDGESISATRVIVATGPGPFAWKPPQFDDVPASLVSHSSQHQSFREFAGRRVLVVGAGQSALESAALLHESSADVEVVLRRRRLYWLDEERMGDSGPIHRFFYRRTGVGPVGVNWLVAAPGLFQQMPIELRRRVSRRALRPAGAFWLRSRLAEVPITAGRSIVSAAPRNGTLRLRLDNGSERDVDHVLLATGYRVDLARYAFLPRHLSEAIRTERGFPQLNAGLESSVPGIHFLGAPATGTFGPGMMFVVGTGFSARALVRSVLKHSSPTSRSS
jgi:FAD-dependent urate hydroxylase